jgi:TusA-related sulfurtransferase
MCYDEIQTERALKKAEKGEKIDVILIRLAIGQV